MTVAYGVNIVGNLTNSQGIVSGFGTGNYATLPFNFCPSQQPYEIVLKFNCSNVSGDQILLLVGDWQESYGMIDIQLSNNKLYAEINATDFMSNATTILSANTDYWVKFTYNGVDTYGLYLSTDGISYNLEDTIQSSLYLDSNNPMPSWIGINDDGSTYYLNGSIDLNESYIKLNGNYVWQGATSVSNVQTRIQLRHDTAANWTSVNPVLLEGEVGIETDTRKQKFGDGSTAWNSLPYIVNTNDYYKADNFIPDAPLTQYWENLSIEFTEGVGEINTEGIDAVLSSDTNDGWCEGEISGINIIDDYWEWSGTFRSANLSLETEIIAVNGVTDVGFAPHIKPNGDVINPDDDNKVLANVYFNDWVRFTIIHQAGETDITTIFDNAQGTTTTTTTALAITTSQLMYGVAWRLNVSPKIDYLVGVDCYYRKEAGGTKYFFTEKHIGIDNEVIDGQWVSSSQALISSATSLNGSTHLTYTVQVPNDGHVYEILLKGEVKTGTTSGNFGTLSVKSNELTSDWAYVAGALTRTSNFSTGYGTIIIPITRADNNLIVRRSTNVNCEVTNLQMLAYRRIGTNS